MRHALQGYWSRRIDGGHRLVYKVADEQLWIAGLRYHY
ncbi:MAG: type II toxin-antitoxin system YoeB family toxin [Opitutaceae bacterium]|nr:type II toxin-antitoxin system YoeB family toxin [Opitutaceae bacterium]